MMAEPGIFEGVRIVELAQYVFVPGAGMMLADQGAEVIKVEIPGVGDPYRSVRVGDGREVGSVNLALEQNNHNKKGIAIDLKSAEGRQVFLRLIESADVFLTSLRPKALRALRIDVADLREVNPDIIYVRGNGLGFRGAEADKPGFDVSAFWARSGMADVMSPPGQPLTPPRPALGDHSGSISLAYGISAALFKRLKTGKPSVVETSLLSTAVWMLSGDITYAQVPSYVTHHGHVSRFPLMSAYTTRDGRRLQLMLIDPQPYWPGLCRLLDLDELIDDPRFVDTDARQQNCDALYDIILKRMAEADWADWEPKFRAWDAPWELVMTVKDIASDPQVIANQMLYEVPVDGHPIRMVASPVSFDGTAQSDKAVPAPGLGEHTDEILAAMGYDDDEVTRLRSAGAIG